MIITNSQRSIQRLSSWATKREWRYQIDDNDDDFDEDYNYDNENKHNNNGDRKKTGHSQLHKGLFGQNVWAFSTGKYNRDTQSLIPYISKI